MSATTIKGTVEKTAFRIEYSVTANIKANSNKIWQTLTNAGEYPQWNSTVTSLEGQIALGETIKLKSTLDPKRTFSLKVKEFHPEKRMVWGSGAGPIFKGIRTYSLIPKKDESFDFIMSEVFSGVMLPLIAGSLPDFRENFEQFAKDLKQKSEQN